MRAMQAYGPEEAGLVPFEIKRDLPFFMSLLKANPWSCEDEFLSWSPGQWLEFIEAPHTFFWSVRVDGRIDGVIYASQVAFGKHAWLNGYGLPMHPSIPSRMFRLAVDWSFEKWQVLRVSTDHCVDNRGVTYVCRKAGFKLEGILPEARLHNGIGHDALVLGITRQEWQGAASPAWREDLHQLISAALKER